MTTELTKTDPVGSMLQSYSDSLKGYAVRNYNQAAFLKSAMIAIADSEELQKTIKTPEGQRSLFNALRYASTTGLSLNPQEGRAALIAYGGKVQYQIMKNGMIDLAHESGKVEFITADIVHERDEWRPPRNPSDEYTYVPARKNRGAVDGYFAALKLKSGALLVKYMAADEVAEHRKKYSAKSFMPETGYGLKTVIKALLRSVSISPELDEAIGADDFMETAFTVDPGTSAAQAAEKIKTEKKSVEPRGGDLL